MSYSRIRMKYFSIVLSVFLLLGIGSAYFYWYEYRPTKIRQDCSWVRNTSEAKPGRPAMSEEELREKGMLRDCDNIKTYNWLAERSAAVCQNQNSNLIWEYKTPIEPEPAKEWWEEATKREYEMCVRSKGLEN